MDINLYYTMGSETVAFAASELQHYLCEADPALSFILHPGTDLHTSQAGQISEGNASGPSICFQTDPDHVSSIDDYYRVQFALTERTSPENYIYGSNERSILLGVYALLRKLGFRFLLPGKTYIPQQLDLSHTNLSFSHHASLRHRGVCIEGADSLENVLSFIDWLPKVGFNSFFLQFKEPYIFLQRFYDHVFNPSFPLSPEASARGEDFYQSCYVQFAEAMTKRSLLYHAAGHGWTCEAIGEPSIGWVKTDKKPSAEVRKLLALVDGQRGFMDDIPMNTNLCYANPEAVECFCQTVLSYIEEHPHVDYLHIWLADEINHICECEDCRKTNPTDQYIRILNKIDSMLTLKKLDCKLVFLLYQELLYPPVHEELHNPNRFVLMFAPISRTFNESYPAQIRMVSLPAYQRNHITLPVNIDENLTYLKKWQDIVGDIDSLDYDYPLGRAHYGDFGYVGISRIISGDIQNIRDLGMNGYISCQELRAFLPNGLPNYLMGLRLLDVNENCDALITEYFEAAYGAPYQQALNYLTAVSKYSDCDYFNHIGPRTNPVTCAHYQQLLSVFEDFYPKMRAILTELEKASSSNELQLFFWHLLDYHAGYGVRLTKALIALSSGDEKTANELYADFCAYIREQENAFQPYLDVYRIIEVSTKYTGFTL